MTAEIDGDRLTDEEIVANGIITMVGGQETTANLIGNGLLTLLWHPDECRRLREHPDLISSAVEEFCAMKVRASTRFVWLRMMSNSEAFPFAGARPSLP